MRRSSASKERRPPLSMGWFDRHATALVAAQSGSQTRTDRQLRYAPGPVTSVWWPLLAAAAPIDASGTSNKPPRRSRRPSRVRSFRGAVDLRRAASAQLHVPDRRRGHAGHRGSESWSTVPSRRDYMCGGERCRIDRKPEARPHPDCRGFADRALVRWPGRCKTARQTLDVRGTVPGA